MSEFYRNRRVAIKDSTALVAFVLGYVVAGTIAWPILAGVLAAGQMVRALAYFFGIVLVTGIVAGGAGLEAGTAIGAAWERLHRFRRARAARPPRVKRPLVEWSVTISALDGSELHPEFPVVPPPPDPRRIRYSDAAVAPDLVVALAARICPMAYEAASLAPALQHSINIGAWDGDRLVGFVRVVTDGALCAVAPDVAVDPDYRGIGIGRALMRHAADRAPRGELVVTGGAASAAFFEHIGCDRHPTGLTLRSARSP